MNNQKGFTLAELMAVVIILAVLSGMAIGAYKQAAERSHFSEGLQMGTALTEAINRYYYDHLNLSASDRTSPTVSKLDMTFTNAATCTAVENSEKPYCTRGRYFETVYDPENYEVKAFRVKADSKSDYYLLFYPEFNNIRSVEKCVPLKNGANVASKSGESICQAMGYTSVDSYGAYRKPYSVAN